MLEPPRSLPALKRSLHTSLESTDRWRKDAQQYKFTDDLTYLIDLLGACHLAAIACIDDDPLAAQKAIQHALRFAQQWPTVADGRRIPTNFVQDHYGGIHDDEINAIYAATTSVLEELADWEFIVLSVRATGYLRDEYVGFHSEDAILLCRMQALSACCEAIIPLYWGQKGVAQPKLQVAWYQIQAWKALLLAGSSQY